MCFDKAHDAIAALRLSGLSLAIACTRALSRNTAYDRTNDPRDATLRCVRNVVHTIEVRHAAEKLGAVVTAIFGPGRFQ
jgi:hypothetical protein